MHIECVYVEVDVIYVMGVGRMCWRFIVARMLLCGMGCLCMWVLVYIGVGGEMASIAIVLYLAQNSSSVGPFLHHDVLWVHPPHCQHRE